MWHKQRVIPLADCWVRDNLWRGLGRENKGITRKYTNCWDPLYSQNTASEKVYSGWIGEILVTPHTDLQIPHVGLDHKCFVVHCAVITCAAPSPRPPPTRDEFHQEQPLWLRCQKAQIPPPPFCTVCAWAGATQRESRERDCTVWALVLRLVRNIERVGDFYGVYSRPLFPTEWIV